MHASEQSESAAYVRQFIRSRGERGPHLIPRHRQVANQFHRIFSIKAGRRIVVAESQLEADAIFWAEGQVNIVSLTEQPMRIYGTLDKKPYFTLDLGIVRTSGEEIFYEIKPEQLLVEDNDGRRVPKHWRSIEAWCEAHGHQCAVMTDVELRASRVLIQNWRRLLGFVRMATEFFDSTRSDQVLQILRDYEQLSFTELTHVVAGFNESQLMGVCATLLHSGQIDARLDQHVFTRQVPMRFVS